MGRYSIIVREYGSDRDVELMEVESNPQAIVDGLRAKKLTLHRPITEAGRRVYKIPKYSIVRVVDHGGNEGQAR
jgi:hypothetical protein